MKIMKMCIEVFLCLCLVSRLARTDSLKPVDDDKSELQNRFLAESYNGKSTINLETKHNENILLYMQVALMSAVIMPVPFV